MVQLFRRILVPLDFSIQAMEALRVAVDLAAKQRGHVHVLHALAPSAVAPEVIWTPRAKLRAGFQQRLERDVAGALGKKASGVECEVVIAEPIRAILAAARKADLIVMTTLGQTGLAHFLVGSTTEKVVRLSPIPVLTIRAGRGKSRRRRVR